MANDIFPFRCKVRRTQRLSAYAFTSFLAIHVTTTGLLPLVVPPDAVENSLMISRVFYQNPVIEPILIFGSVTSHVLSGVVLRALSGTFHSGDSSGRPWSRHFTAVQLTGYLLCPFLLTHVLMLRILPTYMFGGSEGFGLKFLGHGFMRLKGFSWTVYGTLLALSSYHVYFGWKQWLGSRRSRQKPLWEWGFVAATTAWFLSLVRISSIGGAAGHVGRTFDKLYDAISGEPIFSDI